MRILGTLRLGRTGIEATRTSFGALPIQRVARGEAIGILRRAYDGGINFFDTARGYTDSESKIGEALGDVRDKIFIASKSTAATGEEYRAHLETSLRELGTDHIDIYQFHVAKKCHMPGEGDGLYDEALAARERGDVRFIGITAHRRDVALKAAESGLYDTVQFPMSYLSSDEDLELVKLCRKNDVGFIAMKSLAGGLITNARAAFAFMRELGNALPIWGIQRMSELEEFLSLEEENPAMDEELRAAIETDRAELRDNFCRGCGYCLPCPAGIDLTFAARMPYAMKRMDPALFLNDYWRENMARVPNCIHCNACKSRCPYELDTPALVEKSYDFYVNFAAEWDKTHTA